MHIALHNQSPKVTTGCSASVLFLVIELVVHEWWSPSFACLSCIYWIFSLWSGALRALQTSKRCFCCHLCFPRARFKFTVTYFDLRVHRHSLVCAVTVPHRMHFNSEVAHPSVVQSAFTRDVSPGKSVTHNEHFVPTPDKSHLRRAVWCHPLPSI